MEKFTLFKHRTILLPTIGGLICILLLSGSILYLIASHIERFLAVSSDGPADVLIVEGWIGKEGVKAAADEFKLGGYKYVIAAGGKSTNRWNTKQWSYAEEAGDILLSEGIARQNLLIAPCEDFESDRTFHTAMAVLDALKSRQLSIHSAKVLTLGVHARRSRQIFQKVLGRSVDVKSIAWTPHSYRMEKGFWTSSERTEDVIKELYGLIYAFVHY